MPRIEIAPELIFQIFGFPVTNTMLMTWIVFMLLAGAAYAISRNIRMIPTGIQNVFEILVELFAGLMETMLGSREKAERYVPIIGTIFIFILLSNWLGILPGIGSIGIIEEHD